MNERRQHRDPATAAALRGPRRGMPRDRDVHVRPRLFAAVALAALSAVPRAAQGGDFDGRWALLQSTTTVAEVPIAGRIYATTTALSIHDLVSSDTRLRGEGALCSVSVDSGTSFVRTSLPPALRRILPAPTFDAELSVVGGKLAIFQASRPIVLGARLRRSDEPLPTEIADPRVLDEDEDGAPGVTVRVDGIASGDIHVVQRSWARLDGLLRVDGTFGGIVRHGVSQSVLDATSPFLRDPPDVTPVPARSWFRLGRLGVGAGCAEATRAARAWSR